MNLRRTLAISRRIANQFRRDHRTLALMFVAPIVILGLLGWVISDQTPSPTRLAVINQAGRPGEVIRGLIDAVASDGGLQVDTELGDEAAGREALAAGTVDVVVVLPESLPADVASGVAPTIRLITPGLNPTDDGSRLGALQQVVVKALAGARPLPTIEHEHVFGSAEGDFLDAFAPALVGFFAFFLVFILTGVSFLRERIGGTLERLLATPIRRSEIVAGYGVGFGFFATLQVALIMAFSLGHLDLPSVGPVPAFTIGLGIANAGSPALAFLVTLLLALGAVNLGIFISTFTRTEFQVLQFIPIIVVPQGLLGGIFWPVSSLPDVLEPVARILPLTYAVEGLREVLIKGSDLSSPALQLDLGVLAGVVVLLVVVATATIRREVA
ncbi:MAG TPA: ABC transporter permease [Candidatus Limnocylindrales bacterium]|nr:ABC transporter permease [Candidatus Limnocylindrales bacterium]